MCKVLSITTVSKIFQEKFIAGGAGIYSSWHFLALGINNEQQAKKSRKILKITNRTRRAKKKKKLDYRGTLRRN